MPDLVLRWSPIPGTPQEQFFDDDTPDATILFTGGLGSGKTTSLIAKMLKLSTINAPLPGIWCVPDYNHIHDTILPALSDPDESGDPLFLRPDQYRFYGHQGSHGPANCLVWEGGGPIWFVTAENAQGIAGPNVAYCGTDEPGSIKQVAWRNTSARVRHPSAKLRQRVAAGTPEGLNYLAELFGPDRSEGYHVYRMRTVDNRYLPASYIEQIRENSTEAELQAYLEGKFVNMLGGLAYPAYDPLVQMRPVTLSDTLPLRIAFDFNINPMSAIVGQQIPGAHGLEFRVHRSIALFGSSTYQLAAEIQKHYPSWPAGVWIYGDATGKERQHQNLRSNYDILRTELATIGPLTMRVPAANPGVSQRLNSVNRLCRDGRGITRLYLNGDPQAPRQSLCRALSQSLQQTVIKPGTDDIWKKQGETVSHAGDALCYWLDYEAPARRPDAGIAVIKATNGHGHQSHAMAALRAEKSHRLRQELEALRGVH